MYESKKLLYIINVPEDKNHICAECFYNCNICSLKFDNIHNNKSPRYLIKFNDINQISCNNCFIINLVYPNLINFNKQFDNIHKRNSIINENFKNIHDKLKVVGNQYQELTNKYDITFKNYDNNFKTCKTNLELINTTLKKQDILLSEKDCNNDTKEKRIESNFKLLENRINNINMQQIKFKNDIKNCNINSDDHFRELNSKMSIIEKKKNKSYTSLKKKLEQLSNYFKYIIILLSTSNLIFIARDLFFF